MKLEIHHHHHSDPELLRRLDRNFKALQSLQEGQDRMALDLSRFQADLQKNADATSAITQLLTTTLQALRDANAGNTDAASQQELNGLLDQFEGQTSQLVAATVAGTPAAPDASAGQ